MDFDKIFKKKTEPPFKPPADHLNCDPSLELEEMIVEAKPLHKKKKRLAKQRSAQKDSADSTTAESNFIKEFIVYNRYKELKKKAMELKEKEWQEELNTLMANSEVNNLSSIKEVSNEQMQKQKQQLLPMATAQDTNRNGQSTSILASSQTIDNHSNVDQIRLANTNETNTINEPKDEIIDFIDRTPSPKSVSQEI